MELKSLLNSVIYTGLFVLTALPHSLANAADSDIKQCMKNAEKAITAGAGALGSSPRTKEIYLDSFRKQCAKDPHAFDALSGNNPPKIEIPKPAQKTTATAEQMAACMVRAKESFTREQQKMFGAGIDLGKLDNAMPGLMDQINLGVDNGAREQCKRNPNNAFSDTFRRNSPNDKQTTPKNGTTESDDAPQPFERPDKDTDPSTGTRAGDTWIPQHNM